MFGRTLLRDAMAPADHPAVNPPASLPPDRSHVETEQRLAASDRLDQLDTRAAIAMLIDDHRAVPDALAGAAEALAAFIDDAAAALQRGGRLVYVGAGTSGRLGVLDAAECPPTFNASPDQVVGVIAGGDAALRRSSEGAEDDPAGASSALAELGVGPSDAVLGIAAGGTTPYVLGALRLASGRGAVTGLLTAAPQPAPPRGCRHLILLRTGPELLAGSTRLKAGSATKLALNIISTAVFVRLGKVYGNMMVDVRATNDKLRDRAIRILRELCPHLDRERAARRIADAAGDLKTAIVMERRGLDRAQAEALLARHGGRLRPALSC
jgi:N-acetylmuramic acid 6-phosphate etherase